MVRDTAGNPVGGAVVSIVGVPGFGTTSEPDGRYKLAVPAANALLLEAQKAGYRRIL
ncbi:MAG: carboxypeptidase regulatory-like domain-containing protein [Holophagales bacterium]|nr:carboxypeptidase regulatory-like domain-containing protein [Holophagales bacterium]